jgi:hypothetical protein
LNFLVLQPLSPQLQQELSPLLQQELSPQLQQELSSQLHSLQAPLRFRAEPSENFVLK